MVAFKAVSRPRFQSIALHIQSRPAAMAPDPFFGAPN